MSSMLKKTGGLSFKPKAVRRPGAASRAPAASASAATTPAATTPAETTSAETTPAATTSAATTSASKAPVPSTPAPTNEPEPPGSIPAGANSQSPPPDEQIQTTNKPQSPPNSTNKAPTSSISQSPKPPEKSTETIIEHVEQPAAATLNAAPEAEQTAIAPVQITLIRPTQHVADTSGSISSQPAPALAPDRSGQSAPSIEKNQSASQASTGEGTSQNAAPQRRAMTPLSPDGRDDAITGPPTAPPTPSPMPDTIVAIAPQDEPEPEIESPWPRPKKRSAPRKRKSTATDGETDAESSVRKKRKTSAPRKKRKSTATDGETDAESSVRKKRKTSAPRKKRKSTAVDGETDAESSAPRTKRRRQREPTPEDPENQTVDHSTMTVGELTRDLGIGKRLKHAEEIEERAREARNKYRLKKLEKQKRKLGLIPAEDDGDEAGSDGEPREGSGARGAAMAQIGAAMESEGQGVGYDVVDGQIVVHAASLIVNRHNRDMSNLEVVEENDFTNLVNQASFSKKKLGPNFWTDDDTEKFYRLLSMFGTDFETISRMFVDKNRRAIKLKFNKEERQRPNRVNAAMMVRGEKKMTIDLEEYKKTQKHWRNKDNILAEHERLKKEHNEEIEQLREERKAAGLIDEDEPSTGKKNGSKGKDKAKAKNGAPATADDEIEVIEEDADEMGQGQDHHIDGDDELHESDPDPDDGVTMGCIEV